MGIRPLQQNKVYNGVEDSWVDMVLQGLILNSLYLNLEESEGIRWWGKGDIFLVIYGRIHRNDLLR